MEMTHSSFFAAVFGLALGAQPALAEEICATGPGGGGHDGITVCVDSVLGPEFGPENLVDGDPQTAWCAADGKTHGKAVRVTIEGAEGRGEITLVNGNAAAPESHGSISTLALKAFDTAPIPTDATFTNAMRAGSEPQTFRLPSFRRPTGVVEVVAMGGRIPPTATHNGLCLSEIGLSFVAAN